MNQFFYESRGKEKVRHLMDEGVRSQSLHRSGARRRSIFRGLSKLVLMLATIMGLLNLFGP